MRCYKNCISVVAVLAWDDYVFHSEVMHHPVGLVVLVGLTVVFFHGVRGYFLICYDAGPVLLLMTELPAMGQSSLPDCL